MTGSDARPSRWTLLAGFQAAPLHSCKYRRLHAPATDPFVANDAELTTDRRAHRGRWGGSRRRSRRWGWGQRLENNSRTETPKHDVRPGTSKHQKAGPAIRTGNLAKSAKPPSPVQIRAAPPIFQCNSVVGALAAHADAFPRTCASTSPTLCTEAAHEITGPGKNPPVVDSVDGSPGRDVARVVRVENERGSGRRPVVTGD